MAQDVGRIRTQPLILLANPDEWFARSLESVLTATGFQVLKAYTPARTLELAQEQRPDAVILDAAMAGTGYGLCRALRRNPAVTLATAVVLTTPGTAARSQQLEALRAGAWELRGQPLDAEEFVLRLTAYVQGKMEADRLGAGALVDPASGLYNAPGLERRAQELASLTNRQGLALACAVFTPPTPVADDVGARLARAFKAAGRVADAIGQVGPAEFVVFAPATDALGAERMVTRLRDAVGRALGAPLPARPARSISLRAGYSAVAAPPQGGVDPRDLLARAERALASDTR